MQIASEIFERVVGVRVAKSSRFPTMDVDAPTGDPEAFKDLGNAAYRKHDFREAEAFYTQAIDAVPRQDDGSLSAAAAPYLGNRSAAKMMAGNYSGAEEDVIAGSWVFVCLYICVFFFLFGQAGGEGGVASPTVSPNIYIILFFLMRKKKSQSFS
jgi:hypothetical protein